MELWRWLMMFLHLMELVTQDERIPSNMAAGRGGQPFHFQITSPPFCRAYKPTKLQRKTRWQCILAR